MKEKRQSVKKTEAILKAAMGEFLSNGYAATNMDRIAMEAKVSKATLYSYFGDKEGLFTGLIEQLVKQKFAVVLDSDFLASIQGKPQQVLKNVLKNTLKNTLEDSQLHDFMRLIIGESGRFPELAQVYIQHIVKPAIEILSNYLNSHAELQIKDSEATVRILMGSVAYYVILQEVLGGKDILPFEDDRLIDTLINSIIK